MPSPREDAQDDRIPVTVLTGFLGSGKTTLLNRVLREQHGMRIAVVENEFGEVGIDDALVIDSDEEIFEMNNGCICCTVRGDLIRILGALARRRDRFDRVLIETTGLADPAPVAQTFFVDADVAASFRLDAIVTLVDARHAREHLDEIKPDGVENESIEQVAFADRLLLNKVDLVSEAELNDLERRLRQINATAPILRTSFAHAPLASILDVGAFDLDRVLEVDPVFLEQSEHMHDLSVTSVGIERPGELDEERVTCCGAVVRTSSVPRGSCRLPVASTDWCSRACTCFSTLTRGARGATRPASAGSCSSAGTSTGRRSSAASRDAWPRP